MQEGRDVVLAPRVDKDAGDLVVVALVELRDLREKGLPETLARHAEENKQLLKKGIAYINGSNGLKNILPTLELTVSSAEGVTQTVQEQLLFVTSVGLPDECTLDYYLSSQGELLAYTRAGEITVSRGPAVDKDYISYVADAALLAIANSIEEASDTHPSLPPLRLVKS
ncbi:MAG: hypothetical protein ABSE17_00385 [Candidatus Levyibacteriota bacterium]|jgi:hypothetical protein